jgi:DNA-binding transcriptional MerR regulator
MPEASVFTIGKLAGAAHISADTLRYYEREGLLEPAGRTASSYRLYDSDAIARVRFIRHAQACGFTLLEIRELLALRARTSACCADVRTQAIEKKLQLERRIRALKAMSKALDGLIADCARDAPIAACPILAAFEAAIGPAGRGSPS